MTENSGLATLIGFRPGAVIAALYLATLTSPASRRSMASSLDRVACVVGDSAGLELDGDPDFPPRDRIDWRDLDYPAAVTLRALMVPRWAPATVNRHLAAVRGVVRTARLAGLSPTDQADAVATALSSLPRSPGPSLAGQDVTAGMLRTLFADIAGRPGPVHRRDAAMLAILTMGAVRRSELAACDLDDYADGRLHIRHGKGGRERLVFLHGGGALAVADWLTVRGESSGPLLTTFGRGGTGRMTGHGIWKRLEFLCGRAGVAAFAPHDCRRWAITELLSAGQDVIAVRTLAGHASVDTTSRYDRRGLDAARDAARHLHVPYVAPPR